MKLKTLLLMFLMALLIIQCRKDVKLPAESIKPLINKWKHTLSINYNLNTSTNAYPGSNTENLEFEFSKKGLCYWNKSNGKVLNRLKFTVDESNGRYKITYKDANSVRHGIAQVPHLISKLTADSLILADECDDCYTHIFVKK